MKPAIRPARAADRDAIRQLTEAAFAGAEHSNGNEAAIVDALHAAGALSLSLLATSRGQIVGHVAFSPVQIGGKACGWSGLGPISVRPDLQGRGIGAALIREGLERLREAGASGCVVLGNADYYRRFGFAVLPALHYDGAPVEYFLGLSLDGSAPAGSVTYHPAFAAS